MAFKTFGFIGLGLIGGSIARAIRERIPDASIFVVDINRETLAAAIADGVANEAYETLGDSFARCDLIFLCAPVQQNDTYLAALKNILGKDALLSDVGSVKSPIHAAVAAAGLSDRFIGGHPMAGSERFGYLNSKAGLLENAYFCLTPTAEVAREKIDAYEELVAALGAIPLILNCEEHDYVTAAISHLPHVIAASLVNLVKNKDSAEGLMKMMAAGGFKDITRIASSSAVMWQEICMTNTDNIVSMLASYQASLAEISGQLTGREASEIYNLFDSARIYRDSFIDVSAGPIKRAYALKIDIPDETGALAAIATLLALQGISIKNIGIVHNREFEEGVLRIEFYEEKGMENAALLLTKKGYTVH